MSSKRRHSVVLLMLAYLAFVSLGLPDAVTGVAWPSLRAEFGLPQAGLGVLLAGTMIGYMGSSLLTARILNVVPLGTMLAGSTLLVVFALVGYAASELWVLYPLFALLAGLGSGAIDTSLNAYAARHFSLRHMNWLHGFYTVGAAIGPMIMTAVLVHGRSFRVGYALLCSALALLAIAFTLTRGWWTDRNGEPAGHGSAKETGPAATTIQAISRPVVALSALLFILVAGLEATFGYWCFTVFTELRGKTTATAGTITVLYWVTFAGGRFALGAVAGHIGADRLMRWSIGAVVAGAVLFTWGTNLLAAVGVAVAGLGLAATFPTLMSRTPARVGARFTAATVGVQVSGAVVGAAALPASAGLLAQHLGLGTIGMFATALAVVLLFCHEVLLRMSKTDLGDPAGA
jgi:fucose permease